ncbi:MAG: hypothetical protein FWE03_00305 [Firmicutes bacterium]|nr:hypothetical protein [Bacillota bacterium]
MTATKKWFLGKRDNPQLKEFYYKIFGRINRQEQVRAENPSYGTMTLTGFETREALMDEVQRLRGEGLKVSVSANCKGMF